jgi:hypothetical protein
MVGRISDTKNAHTTRLQKKEDYDCFKLSNVVSLESENLG